MKNSAHAIAERQMALLKHLQHMGSCTVAELSNLLQVSEITIRRDLEDLEKKQLLVRYFGGARAITPSIKEDEPAYMASITQHMGCKKAIARAAAAMLEDEDSVFINSSNSS